MGAKEGGEKGQELKGVTDSAVQPRAHCGAKRGERRLWITLSSAGKSKKS